MLVVDVNSRLAVQSARNYRFLRQKGVTVRKTIDSLIATFCIENDHQLLHNDSGLDGYEEYLGLQVIHPWTASIRRKSIGRIFRYALSGSQGKFPWRDVLCIERKGSQAV